MAAQKPPTARKTRLRFAVLSFLFAIGIAIWWGYFTQPGETERRLFRGVTYKRIIRKTPHVATIHVLIIQTRTPGLRFLVTPADKPGEDKPLVARTTSEFLKEHQVQAAINADFFSPWWSTSPFDYYPHRREPVRVQGRAVSEGVQYSLPARGRIATLYLSKANRPSLELPKKGVAWNAVSGLPLLHKGIIPDPSPYARTVPDPRTAVGWSPDGDTLYWVCVDGRQQGYSVGMTLVELADFFRTLGVREAINLDGGGSVTLAVADGKGPRVLNRPIDQHIPGKERYIANHLGLYAPPL